MIYHFDRFHNGVKMAEGVRITTARSEQEARRLAEGLFDNNGDSFSLREAQRELGDAESGVLQHEVQSTKGK